MSKIIIGFLLILVLSVVYLNIAASVIAVQEKDIRHLWIKIARIAFIWLIPIIGFAFILRFTQQAEECHLHYSLIPKFIQNWLYDESIYVPNKNRDDNHSNISHSGFGK
ncbi:hypothetical protein MNB_SUP05-SYMBIONT-4-1049 [hydrothermal vent metagenome]|uniref:Uncharacterized protein n=1 Tax=hydrothermal vent metagenome TaxID=652676 RepID=A0A1W1DYH1_9ZZZZ